MTGASGFIGSWVMQNLPGHSVFGLDRNPSSDSRVRSVDLTSLAGVTGLFEEVRPEAVIHLGAVTGATGENEIEQSMRQAYTNFSVNTLGTANVCEAARVTGVRRLIYASSFATYGRTGRDRLPITESTPVELHHAYANSKYAGELVVNTYAQDFGIRAAAFRLPFIVGERQKEKNALREFINAAEAGGELLVFGDGSQLRTFLHVQDLVRAFDRALDRLSTAAVTAKNPEPFVLGSPPVSMESLARMVISHVGSGTVKYVESTRAFSQYSDYTKAREFLGWYPSVSTTEIVRRMVAADREAKAP